MRVMDNLIDDHDLQDELEDRMIDETGNTNFWLGYDSEDMDEGSDKEDPEAVLAEQLKACRQEQVDLHHFVRAASDTLALRAMLTEVERARMQSEDWRSHACR